MQLIRSDKRYEKLSGSYIHYIPKPPRIIEQQSNNEFYGGILAAIGGILLALGPFNLYLVPASYILFLISAIMLVIWSKKKDYKGILIMNIVFVIVDLIGFVNWTGKAMGLW